MLGWIAGFAAGAAHALSGPDHLAAVAPLAADRPAGAWRIGLRWGAGHALAAGAVGALALALRGRIDPVALSGHGERLAGLALVALGLWGARRAVSRFVHVHEHEHDGIRHRHLHLHPAGIEHPHPERHAHRHLAFGFGVLHGIAGAPHVLAVLPALALPGSGQAAAYVAAFALGTLAAMAVFGGVLGRIAAGAGGGVRGYRWMLSSASALSLIVGAAWLSGWRLTSS